MNIDGISVGEKVYKKMRDDENESPEGSKHKKSKTMKNLLENDIEDGDIESKIDDDDKIHNPDSFNKTIFNVKYI